MSDWSDFPLASPTPSATPEPPEGVSTPSATPLPGGIGTLQPNLPNPDAPPPAPNKPAQPAQPEQPSDQQPAKPAATGQIENLKHVVGSEFGEIDNPVRGGYTEPGWNRGAWGANLAGENNHGFALPDGDLKQFENQFGPVRSPDFAEKFNKAYDIVVINPKTGAQEVSGLVDRGPGPNTGAGIDILWGSRAALGFPVNFKGPVNFAIVPKGTAGPAAKGVAFNEATSSAGAGGAGGKGGAGAAGAAGPSGIGVGGFAPGITTPFTIPAGEPPGPAPGQPSPEAEVARMQGPEPTEEGGGGGDIGAYSAMYAGGYQPQPALGTPPQAPGVAPSLGPAPTRGGAATFMPSAASTEGNPTPPGFEQLTPHIQQGTSDALKQAQNLHTNLLSDEDTRVRKQPDLLFKGQKFLPGDPLHEAVRSNVPPYELSYMRQAENAIANNKLMHASYASAPRMGMEELPTRAGRQVDYAMGSAQHRLLGQTRAQVAGHSFMPVNIGVALAKKQGEPHQGFIQGVSTHVLANNHALINKQLAAMGENSPYPHINNRFMNDMEGYISNLRAGHRGTGDAYAPGMPVNKEHIPYPLNKPQTDFLNLVINNQEAIGKGRTAKATAQKQELRELARKGGTLLTEAGETNPLRQRIDAAAPMAGKQTWSQHTLEPSIRTFKAGLIEKLHDRPEEIPEPIRQPQEYGELAKGVERQSMHQARRPVAVTFMPPLSEEEHKELSGNIRKQWLSGKISTQEYKDKMREVPHPGEQLEERPRGQATFMPGDLVEHPKTGERERIKSPAISLEGKLYTGYGHFHAMQNAAAEMGVDPEDEDAVARLTTHPSFRDGFLTNSGRFIDRNEAWQVAHRARQLSEPSEEPGRLISEELPEEARKGGQATFMPFAGPRAKGYSKAIGERRMFMHGLMQPGEAPRFEISDEPGKMDIKGPPPLTKYQQQAHDSNPEAWKNLGYPWDTALEHRWRLHGAMGKDDSLPLSKVIDHPELFKNYPQLKNMRTRMDPGISSEGYYAYGHVDPATGIRGDEEIVLKNPNDRNTLAHELQHWVQLHENYAGQGTSSRQLRNLLAGDPNVRDELEKEYLEHHKNEHPDDPNAPVDPIDYKQWRDHRLDNMAYGLYYMNPGEIEARVAGERAERKLKPAARQPFAGMVQMERVQHPPPPEHMRRAAVEAAQHATILQAPQKDIQELRSKIPPAAPGQAAFMPFGGPKAKSFPQAWARGAVFESPLEQTGGTVNEPRRFEIDDRDLNFKPADESGRLKTFLQFRNKLDQAHAEYNLAGGKAPTLSDVVDHPTLFDEYPHLRNLKIRVQPNHPWAGHYQPEWGPGGNDEIVLRNPEDRETLAHEIQHAVQHYEGFPPGDNPDVIYERMRNSPEYMDEVRKAWASVFPGQHALLDRLQQSQGPGRFMSLADERAALAAHTERENWVETKLRQIARAAYRHSPGEIEARVAGQRAAGVERKASGFMRGIESEALEPPTERLRSHLGGEEKRSAEEYAGAFGQLPPGFKPYEPPHGPGFASAGQATFMPPVSDETQAKLGPRPKDNEQGKLYDKVGKRLDTQIPEAIPLVPDRKPNGDFKVNIKGPQYKEVPYDIANSPLLEQQGKHLGRTAEGSMAKPPPEQEDTLDKDDLKYLNPTDRRRVSYLKDQSAVDAYADKLHDLYQSVKDRPEVMAGKDWYDEAVELMQHHFGKHADLIANLFGATSGRTGVNENYDMAIEAYHRWLEGHYDKAIDLYRQAHGIRKAGGDKALIAHIIENKIHEALGEKAPTTGAGAMDQFLAHHDIVPRKANGKLYSHHSLAVLKVLAHHWAEQAGGPKEPNFAGNLSGKTIQATIDVWAARTMRRLGYEGYTKDPWLIQPAAEPRVNNVDFALSQLAFRKAAERLGLKPSSLQAMLWVNEQRHWHDNKWDREKEPTSRDYRPMLREYQHPAHLPPAGEKFWHGMEAA